MKLLVFLVSLAISGAAFLGFDWIYSRALQRGAESAKPNLCRAPDPVRHHALKPNCACVVGWGRDTYGFFTNSLGFRDEKIRQVPLSDLRPRILMLGDSFTEGELTWGQSYAGRVADHFPQYDFLNGGVAAYSASNYLNVVRKLLAEGYDIDEVIVFIDMADVHFEAAFYHDVDDSGAVTGPAHEHRFLPWYAKLRIRIARNLFVTDGIIDLLEHQLVGFGYDAVNYYDAVNAFDAEWAAWTYRKVNETDPFPAGYAPLGLEGGIAKEMAKMNLLWQELQKRNIPISIVVYPYPGQVVHDTADSRQVRMWRDWCEGKCKRFVSLFPAFLAVKSQCPWTQPGCWYLDFFIFGDFHYNAAGNALVADAVIQSLDKDPPRKAEHDKLQSMVDCPPSLPFQRSRRCQVPRHQN